MHLYLAQLHVHLQSDDRLVNANWHRLFADWGEADVDRAALPDLCLDFTLADALPPLPSSPPCFTDSLGIVQAYDEGRDRIVLHFLDGAQVAIPLTATAATATGVLTRPVFGTGRFEDVTFTSLAPLLRRRGYFLVHAFAASRNGRAALFVGPSGSGKTTTGLSLVLNGWELLANDVVLLHARPEGVVAHPTPNHLSIRPNTMALLPALRTTLSPTSHTKTGSAHTFSAGSLIGASRPKPALVRTIFFPHVAGTPRSAVSTQPRAVTLARLMEESIDRWDEATFLPHVHLLEEMCDQAESYSLHLGSDVTELPTLLAQYMA